MVSRERDRDVVPALSRPQGWAGRGPAVRTIGLTGAVAVMAMAAIAGAAWALLAGQRAAGLLLVAFGVYLGHVAGLGLVGWWARGRPGRVATLTATHHDRGVAFSYSWWPYYWLVAVLVMTVSGLGVIAAAGVIGAAPVGPVVAGVCAALAAVILWFLATVLRLAPGRVILTPAGVHHRGLTVEHQVPWYSVVEVSAEWVGIPLIVIKALPCEGTRLRRYLGRWGTRETQLLPFLAVQARWLATDPALVYRAACYYHAHPERRAELGTQAALERIIGGAGATW